MGGKIHVVSSTLNTLYCNRYDAVLTKDNLFRLFEENTIVRPYLRPISSITEAELKQKLEAQEKDEELFLKCIEAVQSGDESMKGKAIPHFIEDWANEHHIDYRDLIPRGLALEAPEGMYDV